eukprot:gene30863-35907_t
MDNGNYKNSLSRLPEEGSTPNPNVSRPSMQKSTMHRFNSRRIGEDWKESRLKTGSEDAEGHGLFSLVSLHMEVPKHVWETHGEAFDDGHSDGKVVPCLHNDAVVSDRWDGRSIFYLPLLPAYHWLTLSWLIFMLAFDLIYTAFWVPLSVGFCSNAIEEDVSNACTKVNLIGGIVYAANLLLRFQMDGDISYDFQRARIGNGVVLAWYNMRYGSFLIDLISTIPFVYLCVVVGTTLDHQQDQVWLAVITLFRMVRLLPLASISRIVYADAMSRTYQDSAENERKYNIRMSVPTMYMCMLVYVMAVVINLEACIMILIASFEGNENSWMTTLGWTDLVTESTPRQWYGAVYWVITTSTTTGYGDILPVSYVEMVFANLYMILGMIVFGLLVGTVGNMLTRANDKANKLHRFQKKISRVVDWMKLNKIPDQTRREIQGYFSDVWANREEMSLDAEIFKDLPQYMRQQLAAHVTLGLVQQLRMFHSGKYKEDAELQLLVAQRLRPIDIIPGADICQQGEGSDRLFLIQEGEVVALQHLKPPIPLHPPCLVGESVLLGEDVPSCRTRIFTIRTLGVCKVWELRLSDCYPILRMFPGLSEDMLMFVRTQMLCYLSEGDEPVDLDDIPGSIWCEPAVSAVRALKALPKDMQALAVSEVQKSSFDDGSLPSLLEGLLNFAGTRARGGAAAPQLPQKQLTSTTSYPQASHPSSPSKFVFDVNEPPPSYPRRNQNRDSGIASLSSQSISNINKPARGGKTDFDPSGYGSATAPGVTCDCYGVWICYCCSGCERGTASWLWICYGIRGMIFYCCSGVTCDCSGYGSATAPGVNCDCSGYGSATARSISNIIKPVRNLNTQSCRPIRGPIEEEGEVAGNAQEEDSDGKKERLSRTSVPLSGGERRSDPRSRIGASTMARTVSENDVRDFPSFRSLPLFSPFPQGAVFPSLGPLPQFTPSFRGGASGAVGMGATVGGRGAVGRSMLSRPPVLHEGDGDASCSAVNCTGCGRQVLPGLQRTSNSRRLLVQSTSLRERISNGGNNQIHENPPQSNFLASLGLPATKTGPKWRPYRGIGRTSTLIRVSTLMNEHGLEASSIPVQQFGVGYSPLG